MKKTTIFARIILSLLLVTGLLIIGLAVCNAQTRDSLVTVSVSHDSTYTVRVTTTAKHDSTYVVKVPIQTTDSIWRGVYVTGLSSTASNAASQQKVIDGMNKYKFNSAHFYSIDGANDANLTAFFKRIRKETKVTDLAATASSANTFTGTRLTWNKNHPDSADYNTWNLEFEPWRAVANGSTVAIDWAKNVTYLQQMKAVGGVNNIKVTDYYGWWSDAPMSTQTPDTLVKYCDYLLLHDYRTAPDFGYMKPRCDQDNAAAKKQGVIKTLRVIISAEPSFSQTWLKTHSPDDFYKAVYADFAKQKYSNLKMDGYLVFTLDFLQTAQAPANARMASPVTADPDFVNQTTLSHRQYLPVFKRLNLLNKKSLKFNKLKAVE